MHKKVENGHQGPLTLTLVLCRGGFLSTTTDVRPNHGLVTADVDVAVITTIFNCTVTVVFLDPTPDQDREWSIPRYPRLGAKGEDVCLLLTDETSH